MMPHPIGRTKGTALSLVAILATAACSSDLAQPRMDDAFQVQAVGVENPIYVMTQNVVPGEVMDAFFQGPVIADSAGCLRLEDAEGPTVVWPVGYTGEVTTEGVSILDEAGTEVGQVGGSFSFGGGIIPELLGTLGFTEEDRDVAEALCPGGYWIVAP